MAQNNQYEDDDDLPQYDGPSKSQLKREQTELQNLGREMTKLGDDQLRTSIFQKTFMPKS